MRLNTVSRISLIGLQVTLVEVGCLHPATTESNTQSLGHCCRLAIIGLMSLNLEMVVSGANIVSPLKCGRLSKCLKSVMASYPSWYSNG